MSVISLPCTNIYIYVGTHTGVLPVCERVTRNDMAAIICDCGEALFQGLCAKSTGNDDEMSRVRCGRAKMPVSSGKFVTILLRRLQSTNGRNRGGEVLCLLT
jgi:hypothetical protein